MSQKFYSEVKLEALNNATVDTDRFLVGDSGTIKYRTGAEVLSDIGAQPALTNPITGTGTTNYVAKFTGTTSLGNSLIYDDGTNVGIGTTTPLSGGGAAKWLTVNGTTYGGGFISSVNGTQKGALYYDNASETFSMYAPTSVGATIHTNGTERMRITSSGNVGIGTTSPEQLFSVGSSSKRGQIMISAESGSSPTLSLNGTATSGGKNYTLYSNGSTTGSFDIYNITDSRSELTIKSGNVGIGTTSPSNKLDVNGSVRFTNGTNPYLALYDGTSTSYLQVSGGNLDVRVGGANAITFNANSSERMRITSAGNLGLGVVPSASNTPTIEVGYVGNSLVGRSGILNLALNAYKTSSWKYANTGAVSNFELYNGGFDWYNAPSGTAGSDIPFSLKMRLDSSGNLGIGVASPTNKLQISDGTVNMIMNPYSGVGYQGTLGSHDFATITNGLERMRITAGGYVGIGTSAPGSKLTVDSGDVTLTNGNLYVAVGSGNAYSSKLSTALNYPQVDTYLDSIGGSSWEGRLNFRTSSNGGSLTTKMTITDSGNVGIGTTSPSAKLDVSGGNIHSYYTYVGNGENYNIRLKNDLSGDNGYLAQLGGTTSLLNNAYYASAGQYKATSTTSSSISLESGNVIFNAQSGLTSGSNFSLSERMRITSGGNLLLGQTSDFGPLLQVNGTSYFQGAALFNQTVTAGDNYLIANATATKKGYTFNSPNSNWGVQTSGLYFNPIDAINATPTFTVNLWNGTFGTAGYGGFTDVLTINGAGGAAAFSSSVAASQFKTPGFVEPASVKGLFNNTNYSGPGWDNASLVTGNGATGVMMGGDTASYTYGWIQGVQTDNGANKNLILEPLGGNVGIGTTSPSRKLTVAGEISSNYGSNQGALWLGDIALQQGSFTSYGILDYTLHNGGGYSNIMRIQGNGYIGIGTTSPAAKLDVNGTGRFSGAYGANAGLMVSGTTYGLIGANREASNSSAGIQYYSVGTQKWFSGIFENTDDFGFYSTSTGGFPLVIKHTTGNVGIGTTSPSGILDVQKNQNTTTNFYFQNTDTTNTNSRAYINLISGSQSLIFKALHTDGSYIDSSSGLYFQSSNSVKMTMTSDGNVGIGTTSPTRKLEVIGDIFSNYVGINSNVTGLGGDIFACNDSDGNNLFDVFGNINSANYSVGLGDWIEAAGYASLVINKFYSIFKNGNVGIGTSGPGALLDVNGDALINQLTIGQGPVVGEGNTALGKGALGSMVSGKSNIAVGSNANSDNDVTGLTAIGVELNTDTNLDPLGQNCLAISQFNANAYSNQVPHIYVPSSIGVGSSSIDDIITFDVNHYAGAFIEYVITRSDGGDFAAGTVTVAWKDSGSGNLKDTRDVVWSSYMDDLEFLLSGTTVQLRNDSDQGARIRISVRAMIRT